MFWIFGYVFNHLHTQIPEKVYFQDYLFQNFLFTHTNTVPYCTCAEDVSIGIYTRREIFIREAGGAPPVSQKILNMPRNVKNVPMKKGSFLLYFSN